MTSFDSSSKSQSNRIEGLDLIRVIAIFSVVLVHCFLNACPISDIEYFNGLSVTSKLILLSFYTIGALGVPLFFMLSGYLLLPREFDEDKTKKFYRKNLIPLLIAWELWIPANNWLALWYYDIPFHTSTVLKNMLFIEPVYIGHSWFMPVILGIYLFIPYLARVLKTMTSAELMITLIVACFYFFVIPTISQLKSANWNVCLDLNFSGGLYGLYVIFGYLVKRYELRIKSSLKLVFIMIPAISLTILSQLYFNIANGNVFRLWYDFLLIPLFVIPIFILLKSVKIMKFKSLTRSISDCAFGMYLIHVFVIAAFLKYGILNFIVGDELRIIVLTLVVYILSFALAVSIKNIPYIGKILVR